jgi:hypothetical protein
MSNIPPWDVFVNELDKRGMKSYADIIRNAFANAGLSL